MILSFCQIYKNFVVNLTVKILPVYSNLKVHLHEILDFRFLS
jgi:hypothetical protein